MRRDESRSPLSDNKKQEMTTIHDILHQYEAYTTDQRSKGNLFERLMVAFLKIEPVYHNKYSDVWLWTDWPDRQVSGFGADVGIDLVAQERGSGEFCAIQCKFNSPSHVLQKSDIDSFFTASGKEPFKSRIIVTTTSHWSKHAEDALSGQQIPVLRIGMDELENSSVDWSQFSLEKPEFLVLKPRKTIRPHQKIALEKVLAGFEESDRGKLIMACGTGKTYTSLQIAEHFVPEKGFVLFLVPSISLMSQTLKEWNTEAREPLRCFAVCSDVKVGKRNESEDIRVQDLAYPATTDSDMLIQKSQETQDDRLTVVFSTYQSIQVITEAQRKGLPEFDLVICDEAHRTTGATLSTEDESKFVRVHKQEYVQARKRLYMTATPRIYGDSSKSKANENAIELCSMDDESLYGPEFHKLGFSEAVRMDLLSDYKVMILAVDEKYVSKAFQRQIADRNNELNLEDAAKIVGCWNGLAKRFGTDTEGHSIQYGTDMQPMRRAVAFARSIKDSKRIAGMFQEIVNQYVDDNELDALLNCEAEHVDGSFNVMLRNDRLDWLKADTKGNVCRILTNARCLSEGVDVPALDAVMFLNPRDSIVDVVQSIGRVMRKAPGKEYGYVILPIGIPADTSPEEALKDNKKYQVVWRVLQALRAHDDRFNALINKIELTQQKDDKLNFIGVGGRAEQPEDTAETVDTGETELLGEGARKLAQAAFNFDRVEEWRDAIYAKIVQKVGSRRYWEDWAKDVGDIAQRHITRIKALLDSADSAHRNAFQEFLKALQSNLNPGITEDDAIEMLSQHLITKPVFDALFEGYSFARHNPVSIAMQKMLDTLEDQALEKETEKLDRFYESVRERASGIDTAAGKQKIIIELYNKFFRTAFPRTADRMGIVYTPVEVVDFILRSAHDVLQAEFGVGLGDAGVHILDPFTGTGTFMVRLLQSGLITEGQLSHKYLNELHANEIILLAYYIAAINIEAAYHDIVGGDYQPFQGIVLTDTFQMTEDKGTLNEEMMPENNARVIRQNNADIRVIVGNPPYSVGQSDANDNNQNIKYRALDSSIRDSYATYSTATNKNSLYDSYIRAFRWASNRIKEKGIICFVSNGSFIDNNAMDGFRKCIADEFSAIYVFNLRGNARTSGEQRRMESGNVFGEGSRTPVAITLLVKHPKAKGECQIFYRDIGDYLSQKEKLRIVTESGSFAAMQDAGHMELIKPNDRHDWINQRGDEYEQFVPLNDDGGKAIFLMRSNGVQTNRDDWAYNFSRPALENNMQRMIAFYNQQVALHSVDCRKARNDCEKEAMKRVDTDPKKIKWTGGLIADLCRMRTGTYSSSKIGMSLYRPFCKSNLYYDPQFNHRYKEKLFPTVRHANVALSLTGVGTSKDLAAIITNLIPDVQLQANGQCFPIYYYEKARKDVGDQINLLDADPAISGDEYIRKDAITDWALQTFRNHYVDSTITKEDIFYYVYGVLHSPEYRKRFAAELKKSLPRIPFAMDFPAFMQAGRDLAKWHLEYESVEVYPVDEKIDHKAFARLAPKDFYRVEKMKFGKDAASGKDKTTIIYNSHVTLTGIPLEAYEYIVNGKPAPEWIMDRYRYTVDKDSGIINDPNGWSEDPRYILDLLKRIVTVSLETVKIVKRLPELREDVA